MSDPHGHERWTDGTKENLRSAASTSENKSRDHNVVAAINETARADVGQLSGTVAAQIVDLDEAHTARGAATSDDGSVGARRKRRENRRFMIVSGRDASCDDLRLLRKFPIIVECDAAAIRGE